MSDLLSGAADVMTGGLAAIPGMLGGNPDYTGQNTGAPAMPAFQSFLNPDGSLKSGYSVDYNSIMPDENKALAGIPDLNMNPLHELENYVTSGNNNPWVQAQMAAQQQAQGQAMGAAKANAASSGASAMDQAAARGGLTTGAIENLARNIGNNSTMAGQNVIGQGLQQKGQIQTQNAQNQLGMLENLPGQEVQALQPALQKQSLWQQALLGDTSMNQQANEFNVGNKIGGLNAANQFAMQGYQDAIAKQAGQEEAQAQANSGKK